MNVSTVDILDCYSESERERFRGSKKQREFEVVADSKGKKIRKQK